MASPVIELRNVRKAFVAPGGEIVPVAPEPDTCVLTLMEAADEAALALRKGWLGA